MRSLTVVFILVACTPATPEPTGPPAPICVCPQEDDPRVERFEVAPCDVAAVDCALQYSFEELWPDSCGCGCVDISYIREASETCGFESPVPSVPVPTPR